MTTASYNRDNWIESPNPPAHAAASRQPPKLACLAGCTPTSSAACWQRHPHVFTLALTIFVVTGFVRWVLNAYWEPVWVNRKLFAVGPYPADQLWQPALVLLGDLPALWPERRALGQHHAQPGHWAGRAAGRAGDHPPRDAQAQTGHGGALAVLVVVGYLVGLTVPFPEHVAGRGPGS